MAEESDPGEAVSAEGPRDLGPKFEEALQYAAQLHRRQARKGTDIPYVAHLLAVTALVLEHGGDETQAITAALHDAVEDQGGEATMKEIERRFGARVAELVMACSDTVESPKPPWQARKERYLAQLAHEPDDAVLVSLADKVHNARSILADHELRGEEVWDRFSGGRDGTLWYYRSLVGAFAGRRLTEGESQLLQALDRAVGALEVAVSDCSIAGAALPSPPGAEE